jgi:hypothetical protein
MRNYVYKNIHYFVDPYKIYTSWQVEVSNKQYIAIFQLLLKIVIISIFTFLYIARMRDVVYSLLPQERVLAIQEALA